MTPELVIIERITRDDGSFEIGFAIEFQSHGLFAFAFVFVGFGDLCGEADRYQRSGFVVTQAQAQGTVANPLSIHGEGTRGVPGCSAARGWALGKRFGVDPGREVVQGSPTGTLRVFFVPF